MTQSNHSTSRHITIVSLLALALLLLVGVSPLSAATHTHVSPTWRFTASGNIVDKVGGRLTITVAAPHTQACFVYLFDPVITVAGLPRHLTCTVHAQHFSVSIPARAAVARGLTLVLTSGNYEDTILAEVSPTRTHTPTPGSPPPTWPTAPTPTSPSVASGPMTQSQGWSGYADVAPSGQQFSFVSGNWVVPQATCSTIDTSSTQWVGIDGQGGSTVEQLGTYANCTSGAPTYSAWVEMYGDPQFYGGNPEVLSDQDWPLHAKDYAVHAGDAMAVYVSAPGALGGVPGSWTLAISDITARWSDIVYVSPPDIPPAQSSAEWVIERGGDPVTDFAPVTFTNATTVLAGVGGTISTTASTPISLVAPPENTAVPGPSQVLITPGALNAAGTSFTDTWLAPGFNEWPSITTSSLPSATRGESGYAQTLTESGGWGPYTWSLSTGILPAGLSLNSATGAITGTVGRHAISETFTVLLTDASAATATESLTIHVG